jgi:hypothetical protein
LLITLKDVANEYNDCKTNSVVARPGITVPSSLTLPTVSLNIFLFKSAPVPSVIDK